MEHLIYFTEHFDLERTVQLMTALIILYEKVKKIVKSIKMEKPLKKERIIKKDI